MTAIDFPNSPTTGTSFSAGSKTWTYNGSVWVLNPRTASKTAYDIAVENGFVGTEEAWLESLVGEDGVIGRDGRFIVSATAPASPEVGDAWFNSETSRMFIYYDSYWVETGVSVAGAAGPAGVVAATSPITYNSETQTVGITQSGLTLAQSQITGLETALSGKQATITGGATTITSDNLTASRALASDSSGKVAASSVTATELGHLSGVTSAVQTQLNAKANLSGATFTAGIKASLGAEPGQFRALAGTSPAFFIRNDGSATYFMLTANNDPNGTWNDFRPLTVNNSTGVVTTLSPVGNNTTGLRNITLSTSDPSGGTDGDVWLKYNA
jgi:hypothetical protein